MHLLLAAALIAAPAQSDPLCAEVARLAEGAKEAAPFETMFRTGRAPHLLPEDHCFRTGGRHWFCSQTLLPPEIAHDSMARRIAACMPGMTIAPGEPWPGIRRTVVRGGGLVFELEETGSEIAHVGRILQIEVYAAD
jgi:hypothetical protein